MSETHEQIQADLHTFSACRGRFAADEGEREMLHAVRARIHESDECTTEGFVSPSYSEVFVGVHVAMLLVGGLVGFWWPIGGGAITALGTLGLVAETTGRFSWAHVMLMRHAAYNLVIRHRVPQAKGSIVLTTPLDVPRYKKWSTPWIRWTRRPLQWVFLAAMILMSLMVLRALGEPLGPRTRDLHLVAVGILAVTVLVGLIAYRRQSQGQDSGSGAALVLELHRRLKARPLPGDVEVWFGFLGCSYAYHGGMRHFLNLHGKTMASPALLLSVTDPGAAPLEAASAEGPIVSQNHRPTGPALVERLQWAGIRIPLTRSWKASNSREAMRRGYRALELYGAGEAATLEDTITAADHIETMMRWYAQDVGQLEPAGLTRQHEAIAASKPSKG